LVASKVPVRSSPIGDTPLRPIGGGADPSGNSRKRYFFRNGWSVLPGDKYVLAREVW
jgi:hypothetical protein